MSNNSQYEVPSYVYVITAQTRTKVGYALSPDYRCKTLQKCDKESLSVFYRHRAPELLCKKIERYAHGILHSDHLFGEWFSVSGEKAESAIILALEMIESGQLCPPGHKYKACSKHKTCTEAISARFLPGTFSRIDQLLSSYERRMDFVRKAVDAEIKRRKAEKKHAD